MHAYKKTLLCERFFCYYFLNRAKTTYFALLFAKKRGNCIERYILYQFFILLINLKANNE